MNRNRKRLSWKEIQNHAEYIRHHVVKQLLRLFSSQKDRGDDPFYFGDETEYTLINFCEKEKSVKINLKARYYINKINDLEKESKGCENSTLSEELSLGTIEGMPQHPYCEPARYDYNQVEDNMRERRQYLISVLENKGKSVLLISVFPRMGCPGFTEPEYKPHPVSPSQSLYFPFEAMNPDPRYISLYMNVRDRRGASPAIHIPVYRDDNTFFHPKTIGHCPEGLRIDKPGYILMESMGFASVCCIQMTFQSKNITEARYLYDQLAALTPIIVALSAASPIHGGYLTDIDHRWSVVSQAYDDRTSVERGTAPDVDGRRRPVARRRWSSINCYLSQKGSAHNDVLIIHDQETVQQLIGGGMDEQLSLHFASLIERGPLVVYEDHIRQRGKDDTDADLLRTLISTNYQALRLKPPNTDMGWCIEVRPMDIQLTDFENAAYTVFLALLTRVILKYKLDMLIPISKLDDNFERAQKRDAVLDERFTFPVGAFSLNPELTIDGFSNEKDCNHNTQHAQLTIDEIINGTEKRQEIIDLMRQYMIDTDMDIDTQCIVNRYLNLISLRASGELMTTARYMRDFVVNHPSYQQDSVVSNKIAYDLLKRCDDISRELVSYPELLPQSGTSQELPEM